MLHKIVALSAALVMLVLFGTSASAQPTQTAKYYPALLDGFSIYVGNNAPDSTVRFSVLLAYDGLLFPIYPQLRPHDTIPVVRVQLTLPSGVHIVRSKFLMAPPNNGKLYQRYPAKNFRWKMVNGHPTWVFYNLKTAVTPTWMFYVNLPDSSQQVCISAVATFPGVYHAPGQTTNPPGCYVPGAK